MKDNLNLEMSFQARGHAARSCRSRSTRWRRRCYRTREEEFGDDFRRFARYRYLATIDQLWKDHLLAMDHLRQGIGLRGYGQKDPKQEYKKEGYDGFIQMLSAINHQLISQLMRVQGRAQAEEAARLQRQMQARARQYAEGRADGEGRPDEGAQAARAPAKAAAKVGRNDPCPCGSGKKYKKCHGASEDRPI